MTVLPSLTVLDTAKTEAEFEAAWFAPLVGAVAEMPGGAVSSELTIASGVVTPTGALHSVDTEGDASTDDLTHIAVTNHPAGRLLILRAADAGRTVVLKNGAGGSGQILTADGSDFSLSDAARRIVLMRIGNSWVEAWRSYGGAAAWRAGLGLDKATAAEILAGTATKVVPVDQLLAAAAWVTKAYASTITLDADTERRAKITLTGSPLIAAPTNQAVGKSGMIRFAQGGAGGHQPSWNSIWKWPNQTFPGIATAAGAKSLVVWEQVETDEIWANVVRDFG